METKFSIIIPIYGIEKYIRKCIDSVVGQNYSNYEVILVDDGSPDDCPLICDEYANRYDHIVVIHKDNGGLSDARNTGIKKAMGDYIIFLDGDDYWLEFDILDRLNKRICQYESDVICLNYKKVFETGKEYDYFPLKFDMPINNMGKNSIQYMIKDNIWISPAWNKVVKKNLFFKGNVLFVNGVTSEDVDWSARLAILAESFDYIGIPCIGYRQRENSISKAMTYDKVCCLRDNILKVEEVSNIEDSEKKAMVKQYFSYQYGTLLKNIALLQSAKQRYAFCNDIKYLSKALDYSNNKKIKLLRIAVKVFGITGTVEILNFLQHLK